MEDKPLLNTDSNQSQNHQYTETELADLIYEAQGSQVLPSHPDEAM